MTDWQIEGLKTIEIALQQISKVPLGNLAMLAYDLRKLSGAILDGSEDEADLRMRVIMKTLEENNHVS